MGKTNILQHKSWHVYNRDNVERVRKDEENARLEEEAKERRVAFAEQEARTAHLRRQSGKDASVTESVVKVEANFNLFYDEERAQEKANEEAKAKIEAESQLAWEKKVGIVKQLGQGSKELGNTPWYEDLYRNEKTPAKTGQTSAQARHDPLTFINQSLSTKRACPAGTTSQQRAGECIPTRKRSRRRSTSGDSDLGTDTDTDTDTDTTNGEGHRHARSGKHASKRRRREYGRSKSRSKVDSQSSGDERRSKSRSRRKHKSRSGSKSKSRSKGERKDKNERKTSHRTNGHSHGYQQKADKAAALARMRQESALRVAEDRKRLRELVQADMPVQESTGYHSQFNPDLARQSKRR